MGTEKGQTSDRRLSLSTADVLLLAQMSGLRLPAEDPEALAEALTAHLAFVEPLLRADLDDTDAALTYDPRWRD